MSTPSPPGGGPTIADRLQYLITQVNAKLPSGTHEKLSSQKITGFKTILKKPEAFPPDSKMTADLLHKMTDDELTRLLMLLGKDEPTLVALDSFGLRDYAQEFLTEIDVMAPPAAFLEDAKAAVECVKPVVDKIKELLGQADVVEVGATGVKHLYEPSADATIRKAMEMADARIAPAARNLASSAKDPKAWLNSKEDMAYLKGARVSLITANTDKVTATVKAVTSEGSLLVVSGTTTMKGAIATKPGVAGEADYLLQPDKKAQDKETKKDTYHFTFTVLAKWADVYIRIEESANMDKVTMEASSKEGAAAAFQRLRMTTQNQNGAGKNLCAQMAVAAAMAKALGFKTELTEPQMGEIATLFRARLHAYLRQPLALAAILQSEGTKFGSESKSRAIWAILNEAQKLGMFTTAALKAAKELQFKDITGPVSLAEADEKFFKDVRNILSQVDHEGANTDALSVGPRGAANAIQSLLEDLATGAQTYNRTINIMSHVLASAGICSLATIQITPMHATIWPATPVGDLPVGLLHWRPSHWEFVNHIEAGGIRIVPTEALPLLESIDRFWSRGAPAASSTADKGTGKKDKAPAGNTGSDKGTAAKEAETNTNSALAQIKASFEAASKSANKARSAADKTSHRADSLSTANKKDAGTKAAAKAKKAAAEAADHAEADKVKARDILAAREKQPNKPGAVQDAETAAECARNAAKSEEAAAAAFKSLEDAWKNRDTIPELPTNASVIKSAEGRFASLSDDRRAMKMRVVHRALRAGVPPSEVLAGVMNAGTCMFGSHCSQRDTCTFKHPPVKNAGASTAQGGGTTRGGPNNRTHGGARGGANNQNVSGAQNAAGTGNPWFNGGFNHSNPSQTYVAQNNNAPPQIPASIVFNTHQSPSPAPTQKPRPTIAAIQASLAAIQTMVGDFLAGGTTD